MKTHPWGFKEGEHGDETTTEQPRAGWCTLCRKVVPGLRLHLHRTHGRLMREWLLDAKIKEEQLQRLVRE